jgi:hypothetical protein
MPLGEHALRLDCPEYLPASVTQANEAWSRYRQVTAS